MVPLAGHHVPEDKSEEVRPGRLCPFLLALLRFSRHCCCRPRPWLRLYRDTLVRVRAFG
jgi:hypothetical protein